MVSSHWSVRKEKLKRSGLVKLHLDLEKKHIPLFVKFQRTSRIYMNVVILKGKCHVVFSFRETAGIFFLRVVRVRELMSLKVYRLTFTGIFVCVHGSSMNFFETFKKRFGSKH